MGNSSSSGSGYRFSTSQRDLRGDSTDPGHYPIANLLHRITIIVGTYPNLQPNGRHHDDPCNASRPPLLPRETKAGVVCKKRISTSVRQFRAPEESDRASKFRQASHGLLTPAISRSDRLSSSRIWIISVMMFAHWRECWDVT